MKSMSLVIISSLSIGCSSVNNQKTYCKACSEKHSTEMVEVKFKYEPPKKLFDQIFVRKYLVRVVDSETGEPIKGVIVSMQYWGDDIQAISSDYECEIETSDDGSALLSLLVIPMDDNSKRRYFEPICKIKLFNEKYEFHVGEDITITESILKRTEFKEPSQPDLVFKMKSLETEAAIKNQHQAAIAKLERQAEDILNENPDFWPTQNEEPYSWVCGELGEIILQKQWEKSKISGIKPKGEKNRISQSIREHLGHANTEIGEIYFLNNFTATAYASWYEGPLAAASYIVVLEKKDDNWKVIHCYLRLIS